MKMEQKPVAPVKPKAKKEISAMRKITSELDSEVRKVEINKLKVAKFEKAIQSGNDRIKALTAQLNKNFS
jgi:signal transduction histidine kinase